MILSNTEFDEQVDKVYKSMQSNLQGLEPTSLTLQALVTYPICNMINGELPQAVALSLYCGLLLAAEHPNVAGHFLESNSIVLPESTETLRILCNALARVVDELP